MTEESVETRATSTALGRLQDRPILAVDSLRHVADAVRFVIDEAVVAQFLAENAILTPEVGIALFIVRQCVSDPAPLAGLAVLQCRATYNNPMFELPRQTLLCVNLPAKAMNGRSVKKADEIMLIVLISES